MHRIERGGEACSTLWTIGCGRPIAGIHNVSGAARAQHGRVGVQTSAGRDKMELSRQSSLTGACGDMEFLGNCCSRQTTGQYATHLRWPDRPPPAFPHNNPRAAELRVTQHTQSRSSSATSDPPSSRLKPNAFDCDTRCSANLNADGQGALGRRYDPDRLILGRACRNPANGEAKTPRISAEYPTEL